MSDFKVRWAICKNCSKNDCEWFCSESGSQFVGSCLYEPFDTGDIGSASVAEMRKQNGDY